MVEETKHWPESAAEKQSGGREQERLNRDRSLDKTLEDSYPASDPPSTIPDPEDDSEAA